MIPYQASSAIHTEEVTFFVTTLGDRVTLEIECRGNGHCIWIDRADLRTIIAWFNSLSPLYTAHTLPNSDATSYT